ncbi:polysaccharide biosynthesis/export family protein [Aureimonas sp. AU20]|uniref:polysaccharide biosynthesis/export family protein n=1 Tax=Aureimonas sp. AU20 TaxID=1349819 RepID=UPI0007213DE1|nr:polysaccharide biosynthesis/export family protein [Aureimonas sp. AU20]ALN72055.1 hypothetical protein M673_04960 [Aureimonas sp. AU20]
MRSYGKAYFASVASALLALSGCSTLPRSGPDDQAIERQASVYLAAQKTEQTPYALVDLTANVLGFFPLEANKTLSTGFGPSRKGPPSLPLGVGDVVSITLFESAAGGLFIPADAGSRPGNFITLPNQTVDTRGQINVPYAGAIRAAGRLPEEIRADIEQRLADRAIEPQVVINLVQSRSSQISVLGDVNGAAKIEINPNGERVLDAISGAGGLSAPGRESYVTLQRGSTTATVPFEELLSNPRENIFLYPGDVVYVNRERRTFLAFGASGLSGRVDFDESNLTLAEAIGKVGGLLDSRADPAQVFLYRLVDAQTLARMGVQTGVTKGGDGQFPVIFRLNLRKPDGLFLAQKFGMRDKDILYISNSDSAEVTKFLAVVNTVTSGVAGPATDAVLVRNAERTLR